MLTVVSPDISLAELVLLDLEHHITNETETIKTEIMFPKHTAREEVEVKPSILGLCQCFQGGGDKSSTSPPGPNSSAVVRNML